MSDSTNFGGTISGGIQDISALLPLLGTEQCEQHIGSALDKGFLYSSVTPVSIFGSLGIVRASFSILVASFNVQRFEFMGAQALKDSGFGLSGTVAPMIGIVGKRFLAETRLLAMLAEEHIDNVVDLTVSLGNDVMGWNIKLVLCTLFVSLVGLFPYISIILSFGDTNPSHFFPLGFGFPILRVFGSAVCVIITQFLIQIRILILLKSRLFFIRMNQLAKEGGVESLASLISDSSMAGGSSNVRGEARNSWTSEVPAERCLLALERWLATRPDIEKRDQNYQTIKNLYNAECEQHFGSANTPIRPWIIIILCSMLAVGCLSTVVGYVGCFYLIQRSSSTTGTLTWLGVEAALSVLRILVWAANPSWDDPDGVVFKLQLSTNPPIVTCKELASDIIQKGAEVPLTRSSVFLKEVVAYAGPLRSLLVQDVQIYYVLAARQVTVGKDMDKSRAVNVSESGADKDEDEKQRERERYEKCLIIVISTYNEPQHGRMLIKEVNAKEFDIYFCSLRPVPGTAVINIKVEKRTESNSHFLTADAESIAELREHYTEIYAKIRREQTNAVSICRTWSMQQEPQIESATSGRSIKDDTGSLTIGELEYLQLKKAEHSRRSIWQETERSINRCVKRYTDSLGISPPTADQTPGEISYLEEYDAIEKEFLRLECQKYFEFFLLSYSAKLDNYMRTEQENVVNTFLDAQSASAIRLTDRIRRARLKARLTDELEIYLEQEAASRREGMLARISEWQHSAPPPTYRFDSESTAQSSIKNHLQSLRDAVTNLMDLVNDTDNPLWKDRRTFHFDVKGESVKFQAAIKARLKMSALHDNAAIDEDTIMADVQGVQDVFLGRADELFKKFAAIDPQLHRILNSPNNSGNQLSLLKLMFQWRTRLRTGTHFALKVTGSKAQLKIPVTQERISDLITGSSPTTQSPLSPDSLYTEQTLHAEGEI